jgi:hypothetical protein
MSENVALPGWERLAWGVRELARSASVSERFIWKAIADKRLVPLRVEGRTLISDAEARRFLGLTQKAS